MRSPAHATTFLCPGSECVLWLLVLPWALTSWLALQIVADVEVLSQFSSAREEK